MNALRAITLWRPMSAAIMHGTKRIENRPMDLPKAMRGVETVVAVHAGKKWSDEYERAVHEIDGVWQDGYVGSFHYAHYKAAPYMNHMGDQGIVGLMLLTGRVFVHEEVVASMGVRRHEVLDGPLRTCCDEPGLWYSGPYGYEIKHAVALAQPITCRGMQGWWPVPEDIANTFGVKWAHDRLLDEARGMAA